MLDTQKGRIVGVNGNILTVEFPENVTQNVWTPACTVLSAAPTT